MAAACPHYGRSATSRSPIGGNVKRTTKTRRGRPGAPGSALQASRRRVNQESVDEMAELRRQGLTFEEIGTRVGCSERTARRYAGRVEPHLQLPAAMPEPQVEDPRVLRERLARWCSDFLYRLEEYPQPRLSVRFMSEATHLMRDRLAEMDPLTLELLAKDRPMKDRFLKEVVGRLYGDFRNHVQFEEGIGHMTTEASAATWRPLRERPAVPAPEDDDAEFYDPDEDP
jgi:hypothetical protein